MENIDFKFPPSIQSDLFNYLKPEQQAQMKPILRIIKRPYQEQLCVALLDYLEGNGFQPLDQPALNKFQQTIIETCNLNPLTEHQPKSIGTIMKQLKQKYFPDARPLEQSAGYQAMMKGEL